MDTFWIGWVEEERTSGGVTNRRGRISGPDIGESFIAPIDVWSSEQYADQWIDGVSRIVEGAEQLSTLITCLLYGVEGTVGGQHWPMYAEDDIVIFRNQLILRETVPGFDPLRPYSALVPRNPNDRVSEWRIPVAALAEFLASVRG